MAYTVFGAGSIGTVLAGLLAHAGVDVRLAGRNATGRLHLEGDDETVDVRVPVAVRPEGTILLCVHAPDVADLCRGWKGRTVVTFQNGVESEAVAARHCEVIGGVWRMTCTLVEPGVARFLKRGRIVVGRWPEGADEGVRGLAADLGRAGFDVGVSEDILRDKWLKLFANLTSAPNALVRRRDHGRPEFGAVKAALLEEAREVFKAAGVDARSCDGRDASVDEEIERQRASRARRRPVFNATWRQLSLGREPKEKYHDTVVQLASEHGVEASRNLTMLQLLEAARAPECYSVESLFTAICGTAGGS